MEAFGEERLKGNGEINFDVVLLTLAAESKMKNKCSGQFHPFTVTALGLDYSHSQSGSLQSF